MSTVPALMISSGPSCRTRSCPCWRGGRTLAPPAPAPAPLPCVRNWTGRQRECECAWCGRRKSVGLGCVVGWGEAAINCAIKMRKESEAFTTKAAGTPNCFCIVAAPAVVRAEGVDLFGLLLVFNIAMCARASLPLQTLK